MAADPAAIRRLATELPGPINVNARRGGLSIAELTGLGVRRISLASGLHQLAMAHVASDLGRLLRGEALADLWPPA
jgi:2-methylisocitrate lyase-like PEP mutase family enzyme